MGEIRAFLGKDTKKARSALKKALEAAQKKEPGGRLSRFDDLSFDPEIAKESLGGVNMFGGRNIIIFDGVRDTAEGKALFSSLAGDLATSENLILIREEDLPKEDIAHIPGAKIERFEGLAGKSDAPDFGLQNAVAKRDRQGAWSEYVLGIKNGKPPELLFGSIHFALKSCLVAKRSANAEEYGAAGLNPKAFGIYRDASKKYTEEELLRLLGRFKDIYHEDRAGEIPGETVMEEYLLAL